MCPHSEYSSHICLFLRFTFFFFFKSCLLLVSHKSQIFPPVLVLLSDRYLPVWRGGCWHRQRPDGQSWEEQSQDHAARRLRHCWQVRRTCRHRHCNSCCWHPRRLDGEKGQVFCFVFFNLKLLNGLWGKVKHSFLLCRVWTVDPRALRPTQRRSAGPSRSCGTVRSVCSSGRTLPKGRRTWWTKWSRWPNLAASRSSVRKRRRVGSLFNSLAVLQCFQPAFLLMARRGWCQHVNEIGLCRSLRESLFGMLSVTSKHFPDLFRLVITTLKSY